MSVLVEFNNVLALRSVPEFIGDLYEVKKRKPSEFVPVDLIEREWYHFHKKGYRVYPLTKNIPLVITEGNCNITEVLAIIKISHVSVTHDAEENINLCTEGTYQVIKKFEEPEKSAWLMFVRERSVPNLGISTQSIAFGG
jgi:hypothetical protein